MSIFEKPTTFVFEKYTCTERKISIFQFNRPKHVFSAIFQIGCNLTCRYKLQIIDDTFICFDVRDFVNYTLREICVIVFSLFRSPIRMDRKMDFKRRKTRFFITQLCKKKKKCVILFCTFLVFGFFVFFTFLFYFLSKHKWSRFIKVDFLLKKICKTRLFSVFHFWTFLKMSIFEKPTTFVFEKYRCTERILYIFQFNLPKHTFQQCLILVAN